MRHSRIFRTLLILGVAAAVPACGGGGGSGGSAGVSVLLASESFGGIDGNGDSDQQVMSLDGIFVAFRSAATNLIDGAPEAQAFTDIYRKNMLTGQIIRVSRNTVNGEPNSHSSRPSISPDGNLIAYTSSANNIVAGTFAGTTQTNVYVFNATLGATVLISDATTAGVQEGSGNSDNASLAAVGANVYVAYDSLATNLVAGATNYTGEQVFVASLTASTLAFTGNTLISRASAGTDTGNAASTRPSISADANLIAFQSLASNLAAGDTNGISDIYVRNIALVGAIAAGTNTRVSLTNTGVELMGGGGEGSILPSISGDGTDVAFLTQGTTLGTDGTPNDIFIRTNWYGAAGTSQMSFHPVLLSTGATCNDPVLNFDGNLVLWHSATPTLVNGDTNLLRDVYRRNRSAGTLERDSLTSSGTEQSGGLGIGSAYRPAVSTTGLFVAFDSTANNLVTPAPSAFRHVYRRG